MRLSEEQLIAALKLRASTTEEEALAFDPDGHLVTITWKPPPPVTEAELLEAEAKLGFPLPPLLRRYYREVSNGEFGPGGLWKLDGPWPVDPNDDESISLVARYRVEHPEPPDGFLPEKLLQISDWGCASFSYLDCAQPECPVWFSESYGSHLILGLQAPSLHEWFESWLAGEMESPLDWEHARKMTFVDPAYGAEDDDEQVRAIWGIT